MNQEPRRKRTGYGSRFAPEPWGSDCNPKTSPQSGGESDPYSIKPVGAGNNRETAIAPAILDVTEKGSVIVFGLGTLSSDIPSPWAAKKNIPPVIFKLD
jgi:hypothetical protein